ncbi:MAG TPA: hypothetical protein VMN78_12850 [Longimicrobiales bacterium]|nr:hypothetical protein [Longimicrobiales bacterium]
MPRLRIEARGRIWADVRGLDARRCVEELRRCLADAGWAEVGAAVGAVPVVVAVAARMAGAPAPVQFLPVGQERTWLTDVPLAALESEPKLLELLAGVGIERCGELARLTREAVEVRFGAEGVALWRLARAEDDRVLFGSPVRDRPGGSIDFVDYVVTDPARLLFTANALLTPVCERLRARGHHARRIRLRLGLANGEEWRRSLRAARPTASRERWLGMIRGELERLTVPDAVASVHLEVEAVEEAEARQGDLFDRGFATAGAVEAAFARLIEEQGPVVVAPEVSGHPLAERRTTWTEEQGDGRWAMGDGVSGRTQSPKPKAQSPQAALTLQLHAEPRPIEVETDARRDHELPTRYREPRGGWCALVGAAGPDRLSGGHWEGGFAREYFRCVAEDGALVWLFREPRAGRWYLHGWWE